MKCEIELYRIDHRVSDTEWTESSKISFSRPTTLSKVYNILNSYFGVSKESDTALLQTIFRTNGSQYEFCKSENSFITYGIKITRTIKMRLPEKKLTAIKSGDKLSVTEKNGFGTSTKVLGYDKLARSQDYTLVALFNSRSFESLTEHAPTFTRTITKLHEEI